MPTETTTATTTPTTQVEPKPSTPSPAPSKTVETPYDEIDRIISQSSAKPDKAKEPDKDTSKQEAAKPETQQESPKEPDKPQTKESEKPQQPEKPIKISELRTAYENLKKEHASAKRELEQIKSAKPTEDPEKPKLIESLTAKDKTIADLQQKLKQVAYDQSDEYKQKYLDPFVEAYQVGQKKTASLTVSDDDGNERQGTPNDFDYIVRIADDKEASKKATEMFGPQASIVLYHRERVQELNEARHKAIEDSKKSADERNRIESERLIKQQAELEQQHKQSVETFKRLNAEAADKYPQWFKPIDNDEEGNKLLEQGFKTADLAFTGNSLPPDRLVALHSALRNKAGAFDRLAWQYHKASSRIQELEKELEAFKKSEPGEAGGTGKKPSKIPISFDDEIDALAKA